MWLESVHSKCSLNNKYTFMVILTIIFCLGEYFGLNYIKIDVNRGKLPCFAT